MAKFISGFLILLMLFLGFNILHRVFFDYPRKNYLSPVVPASVYLLGDSHTGTLVIEDSTGCHPFNFGYGSDNLLDMKRKVTYLIDQKLVDERSLIVLELDVHLFSANKFSANNNDISGAYTGSAISYFNHWFPLLGKKRIFSPLFIFSGLKKTDHGKIEKLSTNADTIRFFKRFDQQYGKDFRIEEEHFQCLVEIRKLCEAHKINMVGIIYPVHPFLKRIIKSSIAFDVEKAKIESAISPFRLYDCMDSVTENGYFRDQDHLNRWGSKKIVKIFCDLSR